ncbi:type VI secretion system-associated protein TagF [Aureimonas sp. ME7]|uniref:type VI secretion system-associated protein TagF n=1 Tax=Aureimonas sp. ME7 TaxID=2744252 RepID=UPI0015F425C2|nr:type VI secretion system-associated protein TagF [Aureimonas sp. ME7]
MGEGGTGFFGKVPSQGDFVASRFDRALRDGLDRWAQRALAQVRRERGEAWKRSFLAMPPWRFALGADLAGGEPAIGVMVPSQDRVGRPFPLFLGMRVADHRGPVRFLARQRRWFEAAEALALGARGAALPLDGLERAAQALRPDPASVAADGAEPAHPREGERSFWWTDGQGVSPRRFAANGFPAPEEFGHFIDAPTPARERNGEREPAAVLSPVPRPTSRHPQFLAASRSHPGTRLRVNADAVLVSEPGHLLAIAGGQGSLTGSPAPARLAIERLARIAPFPRIADLTAEAKGELGNANTLLRREGASTLPAGGIGVLALLLAPDGFSVVWAGDLRCYLLRAGMMRCLTRDHLGIGLDRRLTRSLGGAAQFACDVAGGPFETGDVFLLATASLTRSLSERDIAARLLGSSPDDAARALVDDALVAGVRDNVSVIVAAVP